MNKVLKNWEHVVLTCWYGACRLGLAGLAMLSISLGQGEITICSWNICNLGKSKTDGEIAYMARVLAGYDLVCVQEISVGYGGAQAVARLADALDRLGSDWDYRISDPTTGTGTERYAFLWKPGNVKLLGNPWLEVCLADTLVREPFLGRFLFGQDTLLLATFHAIPAAKEPWREIGMLYILDSVYVKDHLIIAGDLNLNTNDPAFAKLYKHGYDDLLEDVRTSIKMEPVGTEHFANCYDNMLHVPGEIWAESGGRVDITLDFPTLQDCRRISDHAPVWGRFRFP